MLSCIAIFLIVFSVLLLRQYEEYWVRYFIDVYILVYTNFLNIIYKYICSEMLQLLIFPLKQRIISYNCRLIKNEQNDKENF